MLHPCGGRLPKLDEALREDLKWKARLLAFGQISRIAEGDLEADDHIIVNQGTTSHNIDVCLRETRLTMTFHVYWFGSV